jgi:endonuclease/exonuclease/phosphatase family metal-dependent hydrolase
VLFSVEFSIASYNVENLFDAKYQGSEYDDYTPGKHNWNERTAQIKLRNTAEVICDINSDIIGLQEIENRYVFDDLQKLLRVVGCEYKYSAITNKPFSSIQVALLSRYPIISHREIVVSPSPKVRNILEVELDIDSKPFSVFVNHWKSKSSGGKESARVRTATVLAKRIMQLNKDSEYVILGDLNSRYDAPNSLELALDDTNGITAIGDIMHTYKDSIPVSKLQIIKLPKGYHYNLWNELQAGKRWSHSFKSQKSAIDHIIAPPGLFNRQGIEYKDNSFNVFAPRYLLGRYGGINRWKIKNGNHTGSGYSDHLPIVAFFTTKPFILDTKPKSLTAQKKSIEYLYEVEALQSDILLENATVIWAKKNIAVIKQTPNGRGIALYKCRKGLKVGNRYDIVVSDIKNYKGLKEITSIGASKLKGISNIAPFYKNENSLKFTINQNEVLKDTTGIYKNRKIYFANGRSLPIFFKIKNFVIKDNSKVKILYGHLGYYKKEEIVIYDKNDIEIME